MIPETQSRRSRGDQLWKRSAGKWQQHERSGPTSGKGRSQRGDSAAGGADRVATTWCPSNGVAGFNRRRREVRAAAAGARGGDRERGGTGGVFGRAVVARLAVDQASSQERGYSRSRMAD
ncbi:hypothetical protein Syun_001589 [Stephania yunnanensis]|uniref:Uncharacterized protein n=1 Tax=Stephania yunnanensis TaxID=152371 RepID=A0AAP0Q7X0_9MAGN